MKTDLKTSFTGIQNASVVNYKGSGKNLTRRIIMQLTDEGTKDLTESKPILEKYKDGLGKNFLIIDSTRIVDKNGNSQRKFFINNKELEINENNLNIFAKITNLITKITESEKPLKINEDYFISNEYRENIRRYPSNTYNVRTEFTSEDHSLGGVKNTAILIKNAICNNLDKLFMA